MGIKRSFVAVVLAVACAVGLGAPPAGSAIPLMCPQLCLTGGVVSLRGTSVTAAATTTKTFEFDWTALDLTELPPLQRDLHVEITATGRPVNGIWTGTGTVQIYGDYSYRYLEGINVRESWGAVLVNGTDGNESFQLQGTIFGGGNAKYQSTYDHDWDSCGEC